MRKFTRAVRNKECENTFNLFTRKKLHRVPLLMCWSSLLGHKCNFSLIPLLTFTLLPHVLIRMSSAPVANQKLPPDRGSSGYLGASGLSEPPGSSEIISKIIDRNVNQTGTY